MATHAGAILISSDRISKAPSGAALLVMKDPYLGFARLTQAFYPIERSDKGKINAGANILVAGSAVFTVKAGDALDEKDRLETYRKNINGLIEEATKDQLV